MTHPDHAPDDLSQEDGAPDPRVERTCAAVLGAAWELLIADGPDAVTHAHVAPAARVSRTTVYKHFPTRADLLRATIEVMGKPVPATLTGDLRTDLERMIADLVSDLGDERRTRAIATMLERAQHDETVASVRDDIVRETRAQFRTILESGIATGELRDDIDVDVALAGLLGTFFFTRFMAGEPVDEQLAARAIDAFLAGHRPAGHADAG